MSSPSKKHIDSPWMPAPGPAQEFNGVKIVRQRSDGQRMLLYVDGTLEALAHAVGVSRQSILDWRQGLRDPDRASRVRMLDVFGIPVSAWVKLWYDAAGNSNDPASRAPVAAAPPVPAPPAPAVLPAPVPAPVPPRPPELDAHADAAPSATKGDTTIEHCMSLLEAIRRDRVMHGLTPGERVKLVDSEARMLKLLADLQERAELSEDRYVREHPAWIRTRNAIAEALRPHPAAAEAVIAALERVGL